MPKLLDVPLQKDIGAINTESFQDIANAGDQRRAAILTQKSDAEQAKIVQKTKEVPFGQSWAAAVDTEMAGTAIANHFSPYGSRMDPEYVYDPEHVTAVGKMFDDDKELQQAFYAESIKAQSRSDVELIAFNLRDYRRKQQTLSDAGGSGIAASVGAAIADPVNAATGAVGYLAGTVRGVATGLSAGSKIAANMNKLKAGSRAGVATEATMAAKVGTAAEAGVAAEATTAAKAGNATKAGVAVEASRTSRALAGAGSAVATNMGTEAILQETQPLRDVTNAYATFAMSFILGAAGGTFSGRQTRENKILNEMMDRRSMAAGKRVEAYATAGFDSTPKAGDNVSFGSGSAAREGKIHSFTDDDVIIVDSAGNAHHVPHGMVRPSKGGTAADAAKAADGVKPPDAPKAPNDGVIIVDKAGNAHTNGMPTTTPDTPTVAASEPPTVAAELGPYAGKLQRDGNGQAAMKKVTNGIPNIDGPSVSQLDAAKATPEGVAAKEAAKVDGVELHPDIDPRPYTESAGSAVEAPLLRMMHEMMHGDSQVAQDLLDACAKR